MSGIDPNQEKKEARDKKLRNASISFNDVFYEWLELEAKSIQKAP